MCDRTMVKISVSENSISLRTVSRGFDSPQRFIVLRSELEQLEERRYLVTNDIRSFAELRLSQAPTGEDLLQIRFSWLSDAGRDFLTGRAETVRLPYERFCQLIANTTGDANLLSLSERHRPKIQFQSRHNLRAVIERPALRHKLSVFLDRHFQWPDSKGIVLADDSLPYSFFFTEYTPNGTGICGGVILHGQEDMVKAYYGLHT